MPPIRPPSPAAAAEYVTQLERVVAAFNELGFGSRQRAAFDLRIAPSRLSGVLNFREPNQELLDQLDEWSLVELAARDRPS